MKSFPNYAYLMAFCALMASQGAMAQNAGKVQQNTNTQSKAMTQAEKEQFRLLSDFPHQLNAQAFWKNTSKTFTAYSHGEVTPQTQLQSRAPKRASTTVIEPDWTCDFTRRADFDQFNVIDNNNDGKTWTWNSSNNYAQSDYNSSNGNDDWLVTPPIHLLPGNQYTVTFVARDLIGAYPNSLEVKYGKGGTVQELNQTLMETTEPGKDSRSFSYTITPDADASYYIGFHDNTVKANQYRLAIENIEVKRSVSSTGPGPVTNLEAVAGERGALTVQLSFNAPSVSVSGGTITSVDSIRILRDGIQIGLLPQANAGAALSYTDSNVPTHGTHKYSVVAFLNGISGTSADVSLLVGQDVPKEPANVRITDNETNLQASWNAFSETGANGGYVDPTQVKVSFFKVNQTSYGVFIGDSITTSDAGVTSMTLPINPEVSINAHSTQDLLYTAARADGIGGNSTTYAYSGPLVIGPSIKLPYAESFSTGDVDNGFAWLQGNSQILSRQTASVWRFVTDASDGDSCGILWTPYIVSNQYTTQRYDIQAGDELAFNTPKISLSNAVSPALSFDLYVKQQETARLDIRVMTPDGVEKSVKILDLAKVKPSEWTNQTVDLSEFAGQRYVILKFWGIATGTEVYIGLDNFRVKDLLEKNLTVANITAPKSINAGDTEKVEVEVKNFGQQPASGYTVSLYANGKVVDEVLRSEQLPVLASDTVSLNLPVAVNATDSVLKVYAVVDFDGDKDLTDNTSDTAIVKVAQSPYGKVIDLTATQSGEGSVSLAWTQPSAPAPIQVTEDFESYAPFTKDFGAWKTIDEDNGYAGRFYNGVEYLGQGTQFAYEAFNPSKMTDEDGDVLTVAPGLAAHSGQQYAGAMFKRDASNNDLDVSSWLISPELPGIAQTIKFYVTNLAIDYSYAETFDILYSTTGNEISDFKKLQSGTADGNNTLSAGTNWKEITAALPDSTKYFAIHRNTPADYSYFFGIDDITYSSFAPGATDSITGYNLYRDGVKVGTSDGKTLTFTDNVPEGTYTYNVTALYTSKDGETHESGFSNDAVVTVSTVTGIKGITATTNSTFNIYSIDGRCIKQNAREIGNLQHGVYIINGHKYVVK